MPTGAHSHLHSHAPLRHSHAHVPDAHQRIGIEVWRLQPRRRNTDARAPRPASISSHVPGSGTAVTA